MVFAAVADVVATGVSYVLQYKTYHRELEKGFWRLEGDGKDGTDRTTDTRSLGRNYISFFSSKDELKVAIKDVAQVTENTLKNTGSLLPDIAHEAVSAAMNTAQIALRIVKTEKAGFVNEHSRDKDNDSDLLEDGGFLNDDYVNEDDLYGYRHIDGGSSYDSGDFTEDDHDNSSEESEKSEAGHSTAATKEDILE